MICSQFARVVKGVDLRSTAGNCAWVRTPQLTSNILDFSNTEIAKYMSLFDRGAHGVVVSRLLRMQKALGSNPSGSSILPLLVELEFS